MPFFLLFCAAMVAGFIGALDGIGGGFVLVPILTAFGVDIRQAIAIGAVSVVAISTTASPRFLRHHLPNLKATAFLEFFAISGALIGAILTGLVSGRFLTIFCGFMVLISGLALRQTWKHKDRLLPPQNENLLKETMLVGSYYDSADGKTVVYQGKHPLLGALCMVGVGLIAGLLGGGGSIFIVLVAELVIGFPIKVSLSMSNLMMGVIALAGMSVYLERGLINAQLIVPVIMGVVAGAFFGARLLKQLKGQIVRSVFFCVLLLLGIEMVYNGVIHLR